VFSSLGYNKLKPYGFPIHGCICGYSRRILWLELVKSNNNPKITATLYLDNVQNCGGCPRIVRSDYRTENVVQLSEEVDLTGGLTFLRIWFCQVC